MTRSAMRRSAALLLLGGLLILVCAAALSIGPAPIPPGEVLASLFRPSTVSPEVCSIIREIRLPRILLGLLVGVSLGSCGAAFQSLLRNPLADPYVLGISAGAACGTSLAILTGIGSSAGVMVSSFLGALLTLYAVYSLARFKGRLPSDTLLLSGVVASTFLGGVVMFLLSVSGRELQQIIYLLMGNLGVMLGHETSLLLTLSALAVAAGFSLLWVHARELDLLSLGEESAQSLGVDVERLKRELFLVASVMVGAVVALSGSIGFVGLIVPHAVRMVSGPSHRWLLPASALGGAILLILADTAARTVSPWEIPVGVITALIGVPFFALLLQRRKVAGRT